MIGYKATDKDGCCKGFKFEVGKTYTKNTPKEELECCTDKVFHFCRELFAIEKESNYKLSESRLFEVIAGDCVRSGDKYGTNSLTIIREIEGEEKFFNSNEPNVRMFNKDTKLKKDDINIPSWCCFDLIVWVSHDTATEEDKEVHKKEIEICGGFLKTLEYKEAWKLAYDKTNDKEKIQLFNLPNFDADIFEEISGIDVRADYKKLIKV